MSDDSKVLRRERLKTGVQLWLAFSLISIFMVQHCDAVDKTLLGVSSCATATCHGSVSEDGPAWATSVSAHLATDPHAMAGLVLRSESSQRIVHRLSPNSIASPVVFDQVLRQRCLSCHATVQPTDCLPDAPLDDRVLAHGVSCESCHGPAGGWIEQHTRKTWLDRPRDQSLTSETGFRLNDTIVQRTETCLRCHVGSRRADGMVRDMNHDLIAAGHPAFRFDALIYHRNLPAHWDEEQASEEAFYGSQYVVRQTGRSLGLAAAAALAGQRGSDHLKSPQSVPWPELADFDCFACHQSLSVESYQLPTDQQNSSDLQVSAGLPVWNAWYSVSLLELRDKPEWLSRLSPLRVDAKDLVEIAPSIAARYREYAESSATTKPDEAAVVGKLRSQWQKRPPVDWNEAVSQYLILEALLEDLANRLGAKFPSRLNDQLPALRQTLFFGRGSDGTLRLSPSSFDPARFQATALNCFRHHDHPRSARPTKATWLPDT